MGIQHIPVMPKIIPVSQTTQQLRLRKIPVTAVWKLKSLAAMTGKSLEQYVTDQLCKLAKNGVK